MVDVLLAWVFSLNPLLVWLGGGLICWSAYLDAVPDSDDPRANRDRAMVSGALIIWPTVLIWRGPLFVVVRAAGMWKGWRGRKSYRREIWRLRLIALG